jgi:hypothetical protein
MFWHFRIVLVAGTTRSAEAIWKALKKELAISKCITELKMINIS